MQKKDLSDDHTVSFYRLAPLPNSFKVVRMLGISNQREQAAMVQQIARAALQPQDGGPKPTSPLQSIRVQPIPFTAAKRILVQHHYLHSLPGGTMLSFGAFMEGRLLGTITFGAGPQNAFCLVDGARPEDCMTLTRLWLSDDLPPNSESRVIGISLRALKKFTKVKFLVSYSDPSQGHLGTIYQATGWLYTGLSSATPLYDLGDGMARHSRSVGQVFGSHSVKHLSEHGISVKLVEQAAKHRYIYFLDATWRTWLSVPVLPYPKRGEE